MIIGGASADYLRGDRGNDDLRGGRGNDTLLGGAGKDTLTGGGDNDTLVGGTGDDILSGSFGSDLFVFSDGGGDDRISDFDGGDRDRIDLSSVTEITDFNDLMANHLTRYRPDGFGKDVIIEYGTDSILLENVRLEDFTESDFIF